MRVDDLPAGGGQVVAGVGHLEVAVDRPVAGLLAQVGKELVRVVDVLEPVPGCDHVERRQLGSARARVHCGRSRRTGRVRPYRRTSRRSRSPGAPATWHSSRRNSPWPQPMSSTVRAARAIPLGQLLDQLGRERLEGRRVVQVGVHGRVVDHERRVEGEVADVGAVRAVARVIRPTGLLAASAEEAQCTPQRTGMSPRSAKGTISTLAHASHGRGGRVPRDEG